jgi:hypothetical protein
MPRFHHAQPDDERRQQQQDARFVWKEKKQRGENDREKHHGRDGSNEKGALLFISALPQLTLGTHCSKDDSDQNNAENEFIHAGREGATNQQRGSCASGSGARHCACARASD